MPLSHHPACRGYRVVGRSFAITLPAPLGLGLATARRRPPRTGPWMRLSGRSANGGPAWWDDGSPDLNRTWRRTLITPTGTRGSFAPTMEDLPKAAIFDTDGTLLDSVNRRIFDQRNRRPSTSTEATTLSRISSTDTFRAIERRPFRERTESSKAEICRPNGGARIESGRSP